jgi:hypothetical protein
MPFQDLGNGCPFRRVLPCAIDFKAFSLNLSGLQGYFLSKTQVFTSLFAATSSLSGANAQKGWEKSYDFKKKRYDFKLKSAIFQTESIRFQHESVRPQHESIRF